AAQPLPLRERLAAGAHAGVPRFHPHAGPAGASRAGVRGQRPGVVSPLMRSEASRDRQGAVLTSSAPSRSRLAWRRALIWQRRANAFRLQRVDAVDDVMSGRLLFED